MGFRLQALGEGRVARTACLVRSSAIGEPGAHQPVQAHPLLRRLYGEGAMRFRHMAGDLPARPMTNPGSGPAGPSHDHRASLSSHAHCRATGTPIQKGGFHSKVRRDIRQASEAKCLPCRQFSRKNDDRTGDPDELSHSGLLHQLLSHFLGGLKPGKRAPTPAHGPIFLTIQSQIRDRHPPEPPNPARLARRPPTTCRNLPP